ncbi:hypothetical protein ACFE04_025608 [Oxalis oulophora]
MESQLGCTSFVSIFIHKKQSCSWPRKNISIAGETPMHVSDPPLTVVDRKLSDSSANTEVTTPSSLSSKTTTSFDASIRTSTSSSSSKTRKSADLRNLSNNHEVREKMNTDRETKPSNGDTQLEPNPINITPLNGGNLNQSNLGNKNLLHGNVRSAPPDIDVGGDGATAQRMSNGSGNGATHPTSDRQRASNARGNGNRPPRHSNVGGNGATAPQRSNGSGNGATHRTSVRPRASNSSGSLDRPRDNNVCDNGPRPPGMIDGGDNGARPQMSNVRGNGATHRTSDRLRASNASGNGYRPTASNVSGNGAPLRAKHFSPDGVMGNLIMRPASDALNHLGNVKYEQGKFNEALTLYHRAIVQEPSNLFYRCNRSDALMSLGRLQEAFDECNEALKLDPSHHRAHRHLARIYLRLGEPDEAISEFLKSGSSKLKETARAETIKKHLNNSIEARNAENWQTLLRETRMAILAGADSAPRIYALQAEALLNSNRYQEAVAACQKVQLFPIVFYIKIIGHIITAYLCTVTAQVYYSVGSSEDAIARAQLAAELDPSNQQADEVIDEVKEVSSAKENGDLQYYASKFSEACIIYNKGLELNPYNKFLLNNRAVCRYSLGQYETALEDWNTALNVDPSYSEARRRRADCYAMVERWEAAIADYEMLVKEYPNNQVIARAVLDAKVLLKRSRGEDTTNMTFGWNFVKIKNIAHFRSQCVTSPGIGLTVVLFCFREKCRLVTQVVLKLCKKYSGVNFFKVVAEEQAGIVRSECHSYFLPVFKIYKNGISINETPGMNGTSLDQLIQTHIT